MNDKFENVKLPDGEPLNESRFNSLELGWDHYWRFHEHPSDWKEYCPVCKKLCESRFDIEG